MLFITLYFYLNTMYIYLSIDSVSHRKLAWAILTTLVQSVVKTSRLKGKGFHLKMYT